MELNDFFKSFKEGFNKSYNQEIQNQNWNQNQNPNWDQNQNQNLNQNQNQNWNQNQGQNWNQQNQNWNQNLPNDPIQGNIFLLHDQHQAILHALTANDDVMAEQTLIMANTCIRYLEANLSPYDFVVFKVEFQQIDLTAKFIKALNLFNEERFQKAYDQLQKADEICEQALNSFKTLLHDHKNDPNFVTLLPFLQNYFYYFDVILDANKILFKAEIDKLHQKFVDDYKINKEAAEAFRKINSIPFEVDPNLLSMGFIKRLNKYANQLDIKAERLEEKQKTIQFVPPHDKKIFIVHGHAYENLKDLENHLITQFHLDPIILNQEPDHGKTIIEKFEHYAKDCAFAFVLVTPDDAVKNKEKEYFQGRPNVLFELGWFSGRFGRNKVRILRQKDTYLPSDLNGIISIEFKENLSEIYDKIHDDLVVNGILEN